MDINNLWSVYDLNSKKQNTRCLAVNTILEGKYLVGPVLGQGGFGITYVGYDLNMEAKIAIKEYFPVELVSRDTTTMHGDRVLSLSGEKSVTYKAGLKKYVAEAQNVSQFSEIPGVVSVKDFFYANETAYIVMEFIDGISLKDYLKEKGGRLPEEETLKIMKPVLEALVQVHKSGIIHRDISPDNIMLTFKDGDAHNQIESVKLIDFGAARMTEKNDQKSLTIILKHGYAPEEQYRTHGEQGSWTDVYALCAVLYRMLTGETPVPAMDRMFKDELKPLKQCGAKVGANTAAAILKGLAIKKDDRIQSVKELMEALYEGAKVKTVKVSKFENTSAGSGTKNKKTPLMIGASTIILAIVAFFVIGKMIDNTSVTEISIYTAQTGDVASNDIKTENVQEDFSTMEILDVNTEEDNLGEQIVEWSPQTSISVKQQAHTLICKPDGTVSALGGNNYGQCMVQEWDHIMAVSAGNGYSVGLRSDGKVFAAGNNASGQCNVENWEDIVAVACGYSITFGLKQDGTVVACGLGAENYETYAELENIKAITAIDNTLVALENNGTVHFSSDTFMNGEELPVITGWDDVEYLSCGSMWGINLIGLTADGSIRRVELVRTASSEEENPHYEGIEKWSDIQQIYTNSPVVAVKNDGSVACIESVNANSHFHERMKQEISKWDNMVSIASVFNYSRIHIIGLREDGTILQYRANEGNSSPKEMTNVEWLQFIDTNETNLVAKTKDNKILTYGLSDSISDGEGRLQKFLGDVKDVSAIVGSRAVLNKDGQLVTEYETYTEESGFLQAFEMWSGIYVENTMPTYGYALLTKNHKIKIKVYGESAKSTVLSDRDPGKAYEMAIQAEEWDNVVQLELARAHTGKLYALHENGTVSTTVAENREQLQSVQGIKRIAVKDDVLLGIREDGTVAVLLADAMSVQLGKTQVDSWSNIKDMAISESHVVGLKEDGTVVASGSNHTGQCDVEDWENIVSIVAGNNCTLGITADGELKMAGIIY